MQQRRGFLGKVIAIFLVPSIFAKSSSVLAGGGYKVVVNADNPSGDLKKKDVANFMLKKKSKWSHGEKVRPVDLKRDSDTREAFSKGVLNRSVSAVVTYWQQRVFAGRGLPPPMKGSDGGVLAYVRGNAGAIGYVSAGADTSGVKVLQVL